MIYDLQKASVLKRISAYLFDLIIFATVAAAIALAVSAILGYDAKSDRMQEIYEEYEKEFGIDLEISEEDATEEEKERRKAAQEKFSKDVEVIYLSDLLFTLAIFIVTFTLFLTFLILEFIIPLFLKNGQTIGKKIFGIAIVSDASIKITPVMLFVRSILGKYTIETMVPLFLLFLGIFGNAGAVGIIAAALIFVFQIGLIIKTKTHSAIHDILAYTVAVDLESQMIFESKEALIEYKNKIHAEMVDKKDY